MIVEYDHPDVGIVRLPGNPIKITAAHGPSTTAISVPPTPWAVVPPGTGTLNIMIVKLSAEKIARSGTVRLFRTFLTR